jgi:hypothetical protein
LQSEADDGGVDHLRGDHPRARLRTDHEPAIADQVDHTRHATACSQDNIERPILERDLTRLASD